MAHWPLRNNLSGRARVLEQMYKLDVSITLYCKRRRSTWMLKGDRGAKRVYLSRFELVYGGSPLSLHSQRQ
jgi:hypothetical protein